MAHWNRLRHLVLWLGLVLFVVGAKLWLIDEAGSSVPRWDQIDAEGELVLRPWAEGELEVLDLWRSHNEHRIVFTKLYALGITAGNGQWDAYVEMLGNAVLHAALLPFLLGWLRPHVSGVRFGIIALLGVALWALPLSWENTLQGFQGQFYHLIWLAVLQIRGVLGGDQRRFDWRWMGGQLCGLLALGAMGSGMLASIAVAIVVMVDLVRTREFTRWRLVTLGLSMLWVILGWWSRTPFPGHDPLRAQSVGEFLDGLSQIMSWPLQGWAPWTLVALAPLVWWGWRNWREQERDGFGLTFTALAVWVGLIAAATAMLRYHGGILSSRYQDQYALGVLLVGVSYALLPLGKGWRTALLMGWVGLIGWSLGEDVHHNVTRTIPRFKERVVVQEANVRGYLTTGNEAFLRNKGTHELPHPSGELLALRWSNPTIQTLMPAAVRAPVALPSVPADSLASLPPAPYPVVAVSPDGPQNEPWVWRSDRQSADALPILRFRFSGALGDPNAALQLRVMSDAGEINVLPDGSARNRWKTINVIRPAGEWWIELKDSDSAEHVALTAPVELGWLSWATEKMIKYHVWFISGGLALLLGGLLAAVPAQMMSQKPDNQNG